MSQDSDNEEEDQDSSSSSAAVSSQTKDIPQAKVNVIRKKRHKKRAKKKRKLSFCKPTPTTQDEAQFKFPPFLHLKSPPISKQKYKSGKQVKRVRRPARKQYKQQLKASGSRSHIEAKTLSAAGAPGNLTRREVRFVSAKVLESQQIIENKFSGKGNVQVTPTTHLDSFFLESSLLFDNEREPV